MGINKIKGLLKSLCIIVSTVLLCSFVMPYITLHVKAGSSGTYANLVIFVRMQGDTEDEFNEGTNWQQIKEMYNTKNNSFTNYINAISDGKVNVVNYFPQENSEGSGVNVFTLSQSIYGNGDGSSDEVMVKEILDAIRQGTISLGDYKLDYQESGVVDNLTIIVQGKDINGNTHAYHKTYSGNESIKDNQTLTVSHYNAIPSDYIINADGQDTNLKQQQGVICHEFLHTLGFTDLYQQGESSNKTVGVWDIMATNTWYPQYPLSYSRVKQGWIDSAEITKSGDYTLNAVTEKNGTRLYTIRTPLPEGNSEIICLEYRKQQTDTDPMERFVYTGLLIYRVDEKVTSMSNFYGQNYYYVFRPQDDADKTGEAAIGPENLDGVTTFGDTDLTNNDKTDNIIYYSDGQNSGIKLSNVSINGTELTFHIEFAKYDGADILDNVGGNAADDVEGDAYLYTDPATGQLYAAYVKGTVSNGQAVVKKWNKTSGSWEQVGSPVSAYPSKPEVAVCNGELYLMYYKAGTSEASVAKLSGNNWTTVYMGKTQYAVSPQLFADGTQLYLSYAENDYSTDKSTLYIDDVLAKKNIATRTGKYLSDFAVTKWGNKLYVAYAYFISEDKSAMISYDISSGKWTTEHTYDLSKTSVHAIEVQNGKLYAYLGGNNPKPVVSVYDGSTWTDTYVSEMGNAYKPSMTVVNGTVYLAYMDNSSQKGKLIKQGASGFESVNDNLGLNLEDIVMCSYNNTIYVGTRSQGTKTLTVSSKQVADNGNGTQPTTPTPAPTDTDSITASKPMTLEVAPPSGYNDNHIYIDGVEYAATRSGGRCTLSLKDTNGKTAVMYCYNSSNVPTGMYVWKLSYSNNYCTAKPLKGLENLISYHGFSIRVQSPAGIRFKSGIDTNVKSKLINSNVDGYHLVEYGTLFMTDANRKKYPFVKDGTKVGGGRSYWVENGKTNDKVFETVNGRNRFASVLINLSKSQYATNIAFRGYIILENSEGRITVYGPPVSRSIYTVAKQVLKKGEFPAGSSGYNYVNGIVKTVEGK